MSNDLNTSGYEDIAIMGLNSIAESDVPINQMVKGNTLPWGSDNDQYQIWKKWKVTLRDLYVFKPNGEFYAWMNLTDYNPEPTITDSTNYKALRQLLIDAVTAEPIRK